MSTDIEKAIQPIFGDVSSNRDLCHNKSPYAKRPEGFLCKIVLAG